MVKKQLRLEKKRETPNKKKLLTSYLFEAEIFSDRLFFEQWIPEAEVADPQSSDGSWAADMLGHVPVGV